MMNCPVCLLNLVEEKKYQSSQPEYLYYIREEMLFASCKNVITCNNCLDMTY